MAGRPEKYTVDFFSHDAGAGHGRTLTILFNRFGHEGISAWWLLLEQLSSTRNHAINVTKYEDFEYLAANLHFQPDRFKEILDKMADIDAIDKDLYKAGTIWCQNLVNRFDTIYKKRDQPLPAKPETIKPIKGNINSIKGNINSISDSGHNPPPTSSVKPSLLPPPEIKLNKIKETKEEREEPSALKDMFFSFQNDNGYKVVNFENEFKKFCEYWLEGTRKLKNKKLACHNWLDHAVAYEKQFGGKDGSSEKGYRINPSQTYSGAFDDVESSA